MSIENLEKFFDWAQTTGRAQVIFMHASSLELRSLLDCTATSGRLGEAMGGFSREIDQFKEISLEKRRSFANTNRFEWDQTDPELYLTYRMAKVLWLLYDIRDKGIQQPMQLQDFGRFYTCHPGGDKKIAAVFMLNLERIPLFYIWYPEVNQSPWHWTRDHTVIRSPQELADKFVNANHPTFNWHYDEPVFTKGDLGFAVTNEQMEPWARGMALLLRKSQKYWSNPDKFRLQLPTFSYVDAVHRVAMEQQAKRLVGQLIFKDDRFLMGPEYQFRRKEDGWLFEGYDHFPKSLVDTDYREDPARERKILNTRGNISNYRKDL